MKVVTLHGRPYTLFPWSVPGICPAVAVVDLGRSWALLHGRLRIPLHPDHFPPIVHRSILTLDGDDYVLVPVDETNDYRGRTLYELQRGDPAPDIYLVLWRLASRRYPEYSVEGQAAVLGQGCEDEVPCPLVLVTGPAVLNWCADSEPHEWFARFDGKEWLVSSVEDASFEEILDLY